MAVKAGDIARRWLARSGLLDFDFVSLSAFRVAFALFLAYSCWQDLTFFSDFYSDDGVLPRRLLEPLWGYKAAIFSLLVPDHGGCLQFLFCAVYVAAVIAFGIGYRTRLATVVLTVLRLSLYWRNIPATCMIPHLANILLIWSCFLPLNRYWSVDAVLDPAPRDRPTPKLPLLGLKLQLASIYFFSFFFKLAGKAWISGDAILHTLQGNFHGQTPLDIWLVGHASGLLTAATYGVMAFQFLFMFLVYSPFKNDMARGLALTGAVAMHTGFLLLMHIGLFPELCFCYLLLLVPDRWWTALFVKRRARLRNVAIFYDDGCVFCHKTALLLREFCLPAAVPVMKAGGDAVALDLLRRHRSWVVRDAAGAMRLKWDAVAYVMRQSPVLFPIGWLTNLPFLRRMMEKAYDGIGARRNLLGRVTAVVLPWRTAPPPGRVAQGFCALLAALTLACNLIALPRPYFLQDKNGPFAPLFPAEILVVETAAFFQVAQMWNLYAPNPPNHNFHMVTQLKLRNGYKIEFADRMAYWPQGVDVYREKDRYFSWQRYFRYLLFPSTPSLRDAFGDYLCRKLNVAPFFAANPVVGVDIAFHRMAYGLRWPADRDEGEVLNYSYDCSTARP